MKVLLIMLFAANVNASYIQVLPELQAVASESEAGTMEIAGTVTNNGDDTALEVALESIENGKVLFQLPKLDPKEAIDLTLSIKESELGITKPGLYSLGLRWVYRDSNKGSFSAPMLIGYAKKTDGQAFRTLPTTLRFQEAAPESISREQEIVVEVLNSTSQESQAVLRLVGPREFSIKPTSEDVKVPAGGIKAVTFSIKNESALAGSSYALYAVLSGEIEGQVASDYVARSMGVTSGGPISMATWALVLLIIAFIAVAIKLVLARRGGNDEEPI